MKETLPNFDDLEIIIIDNQKSLKEFNQDLEIPEDEVIWKNVDED